MAAAVIENIGAIGRIEVPETPHGGIVVFTGRNGAGKTTAVKAVDALLSGGKKAALETRDNESFGFVDGYGAKVTIGRKTHRSGEVAVTSLESRIDPAKLVDPGIIDPEVADQHRIRALVALAGVKPDLSLFHEVFCSQELFAATVKATSLAKSDDLVALASAIKRDAEAAARAAESEADDLAGRAKAKFDKSADLDETAPHDKAALQAAYDESIRRLASLETEQISNDRLRADGEAAAEQLQEADEFLSVEAATKELEAAKAAQDKAIRVLRAAEVAKQKADSELQAATRNLAQAESAAKQRAALVGMIEAAKAARVITDEEIAAAKAAKDAAQAAVETGQRVRDYLKAKADGKLLANQSIAARQKADRLRAAADATQDVLSKAVQSAGIPELRVAAGRLVTTTKRGQTLFGELSPGERWRIAIDIAIRQVGERGVFAICQEAWDAVDVHNRRAIDAQVRAAGVTIITAETLQDSDASGDIGVRIYT